MEIYHKKDIKMDSNEFGIISIDLPIWASGFRDASWLFPQIKREKKIAFFNFSVINLHTEENEGERREDDIGKTSRSIPLYIMERLFIESNLKTSTYIIYKKGAGPVVSAVRNTGKEMNEQFKREYDYLITGTIQNNYLNSQKTVKIFLYDKKNDTEKIIVEHITEEKSFEEFGIDAANTAIDKIIEITACDKNNELKSLYKRPKNIIAPQYLGGIAQLLIQTLAQNKIVAKDTIWGEDAMLNWYKTLMEDDIYNECAKLMYIKGIVSSIDYGGTAYISHINGLKDYVSFFLDIIPDDFIVSLSPIIFKKINDGIFYDKVYNALKNKRKDDYEQWLENINQMDFSNISLRDTKERNAEMDILYVVMKENSKYPQKYPLFYKKLLNSKIYFFMFTDKHLEKEETYVTKEKDTISIKGYSDGTIPIFSSNNRMCDNNSSININSDTYGAIKGKDFFNTCRGTKFILNPYSDINREFDSIEIDFIMLIESISQYSITNKSIESVYMVRVQKNEIIMIVNSTEDIRSILCDISIKCPSPQSLKISLVDYNEKTREWLKDIEPVYIRKEN